jgi:molybdopterin converting factor small subunit
MPRVLLAAPFDRDWFGGKGELAVEAKNLFALARALDALAPGFGAVIDGKVSVVVNGFAASDWSVPLGATDEVLLVPKIAGG